MLSRGVFNPPEAKQNSCGVIFCLRGLRRFLFASGVSRYVLSGSTFYERFSGVDFVMWCIPDPRNFYSTLILARFNVFCSFEGKLPEFACLVSSLSAYCPGSCDIMKSATNHQKVLQQPIEHLFV